MRLQGNLGISITTIAALLVISGCGGSSHRLPPPLPGAMTKLTVLITSTANDQLSDFQMRISSLAISSGTVSFSIVNVPQGSANPSPVSEFIHLNGASEPFFSVPVLSGTYTSASLNLGSCEFINVSTTPAGGLLTSFFLLGQCLPATVNLPSPITISGDAAVLLLNLQVSESYTLTTTNGPNGPMQTYTIAPVFTLTQVAISSPPTNDSNGLISGVNAKVALTDSVQHKLSVHTTSGSSVTVATNSATVYQGISGFSSLVPNELVNLDMAAQPDGSLLATRIEVRDSMATGELNGPWTSPTGSPEDFVILADTCFLPASALECDSAVQFSSSTPFAVSGQFTNLSSLPFIAAFNSSAIFLGQNVSNDWLGARTPQGDPISTTAVLLPQTINGTVTAMSSTGGFSVYTVSLAPYDVIPVTQSASGSFTPITNPSTVTVYADSNAQLLTTSSIAVGSVVRFRGAIFNDNGVLRMDCLKILDGVPE